MIVLKIAATFLLIPCAMVVCAVYTGVVFETMRARYCAAIKLGCISFYTGALLAIAWLMVGFVGSIWIK